jgi:putative transcriptional regulator
MPRLTSNYVGGYTWKEAQADARAFKKELAGIDTGHFTKVIVKLPATPAEVKATRKALRVSQAAFAELVGVSAPSVKAWERGARRPDGVASRLIRLLKKDPSFVKVWAKA